MRAVLLHVFFCCVIIQVGMRIHLMLVIILFPVFPLAAVFAALLFLLLSLLRVISALIVLRFLRLLAQFAVIFFLLFVFFLLIKVVHDLRIIGLVVLVVLVVLFILGSLWIIILDILVVLIVFLDLLLLLVLLILLLIVFPPALMPFPSAFNFPRPGVLLLGVLGVLLSVPLPLRAVMLMIAFRQTPLCCVRWFPQEMPRLARGSRRRHHVHGVMVPSQMHPVAARAARAAFRQQKHR
mmetsp:Transcript_7168/g.19815  ORF Transcript_7168/g.19815 Transcript_7168/m.19815 type:complete len:238 (-) Transcript_7168:228-941(-)